MCIRDRYGIKSNRLCDLSVECVADEGRDSQFVRIDQSAQFGSSLHHLVSSLKPDPVGPGCVD